MPNGCEKCWQEFKGWLKAFTPIETLLTILEAILLILLIVFLIFLLLHFLTCNGILERHKSTSKAVTRDDWGAGTARSLTGYDSENVTTPVGPGPTTRKTHPTCTYTKEQSTVTASANETTVASTTDSATESYNAGPTYDPTYPDEIVAIASDGEVADDEQRSVVMALVKIKLSKVTFGCILTVVSERWAVTAASCLDSIEEVDSLDNFVIMDDYGALYKGRSHAVSDVRVHPLYEGGNKSYDLALLQSEDGLGRPPVKLPTLLDYFKLPMGEAGSILGFGKFRTIDQSVPQSVHTATVHVLPSWHCVPPDLRERHLEPIPPRAHGRCGAAPLCLGVLHARGAPCNYCSGSPLLRAGVLLGVMADNEQCGAACEPALYANIAVVRDWVAFVLTDSINSTLQ